jgi:cyanophycinase
VFDREQRMILACSRFGVSTEGTFFGQDFTNVLVLPNVAEVAVLRPTFAGTSITPSPSSHFPAGIARRRWLVASKIGLLLVLLPANVLAETKSETPSLRPVTKATPGSLVIVGGGLLPDTVRERFVLLAGGKQARLVVIPTASELDDRTRIYRSYNYWKAQGLASVSMLHTLDPQQANTPAFVKPLTEATAVWLSGGDQVRLANVYRGTAVERELRLLLARGGVIGGTSAGASVMSRIMITGGNPQAQVGAGFGLLPDVVIDQHFHNRKRQQRLLGVLGQHRTCLGLGIDEQTAVVLSGHTFTILGNANVAVCLPPSDQEPARVAKVLKAGDGDDLHLLGRSMVSRLNSRHEGKPMTKEALLTTP